MPLDVDSPGRLSDRPWSDMDSDGRADVLAGALTRVHHEGHELGLDLVDALLLVIAGNADNGRLAKALPRMGVDDEVQGHRRERLTELEFLERPS